MSEKGSQPQLTALKLLPWPASVERGAGAARLTSARFTVVADGQPVKLLEAAAARLSHAAGLRTGLPLADDEPNLIRVNCTGMRTGAPRISEDEAYWLVVDDAGIYLDAASLPGVLRGFETLAQLVNADGHIPHVAIDDAARFPWRGLLLDPARHFLSPGTLIRTLDGMARCKLNVLHLHLTDDQGFRFHVPEYPKLASTEAYTRAELAQVVEHATTLGIRVVPELDMPGHVTSWLTAYPEWGMRQVAPAERFGVHAACLDPTSEAVYAAIGSILDALIEVFPDPCLHIGGDEVSPRWWSEDPKIAALMARENLADPRAVQGYFNRRVGQLVVKRGRQVIAWDEVLDAGHGTDWVIQAWRGSTMRDRALAAGNRVLVSAPYYLDLHYPSDLHYGSDPAAPQDDLLAAEDALLEDPRLAHVADGIRWTEQWRTGAVEFPAPGDDARLLGGEACLWGELVNDGLIDQRLWQRLPAVAERLWSRVDVQEIEAFNQRQDWFLDVVLAETGIDPAGTLTEQLSRFGISAGWSELVGMLEPVKWYGRLLGAEALAARIAGAEMPKSRPYDLTSPLDGLIDHLPVESRPARVVAQLCVAASAEATGSGGNSAGKSNGATDALEKILNRWQELAAASSEAPAGLGPLADRLGELAELIRARLHGGERPTAAQLADLLTPEGEFILAMPARLHAWLMDS